MRFQGVGFWGVSHLHPGKIKQMEPTQKSPDFEVRKKSASKNCPEIFFGGFVQQKCEKGGVTWQGCIGKKSPLPLNLGCITSLKTNMEHKNGGFGSKQTYTMLGGGNSNIFYTPNPGEEFPI